MYKVYILEFPNGKKYCGQTKQTLKERAKYDGSGYKKCPKVWNAIQKYGWENVKSTIIADNLTSEEADALEIKTIKDYQLQNDLYGYNVTEGGNNLDSKTRSKNSLERWQDPNYRDKIVQGMKNYCATEQGKLHHKEEGKLCKYKNGYTVIKYDLITGEPLECFPSYHSAGEACTGKPKNGGHIQQAATGKRRSAYGFGWRQPTPEDIIFFDLDENGKIPLSRIK